MNDLDWNDLRMFGHVVREGSLAGAAERTGVSAPTIGRQMRALETRMGRSLFARHRTGYRLMPDGVVLYERTRAMEAAARAIEDWQEGATALPIVTVAAGRWMSIFLCGRLSAIWSPEDRFRLCFKTADGPVDIERREAEVALLRSRPESGNLAIRRLGRIAYAPFVARGFDLGRNCTWVSLGTDRARTPAERWTAEQPGHLITVWANSRGMLYDLAVGGAGRAVLPCFLGDSDPHLMRAGPVIDAIDDPLWLAAHSDERARAEVRTTIERIERFLATHRGLFEGRLVGAEPRPE
jgi:DNA-binding transcriptional LysR family regulator